MLSLCCSFARTRRLVWATPPSVTSSRSKTTSITSISTTWYVVLVILRRDAPTLILASQSFYYNNGPGSPVSAAQGKGYLQEFVARFTGTYPTADSALNETFDDNPTYFPLNQSIYADATHEVVVLDALTAFNLTALFAGEPLSITGNKQQNTFVASKIVPFATHFTTQVLECPAYQPTKQIRFIV